MEKKYNIQPVSVSGSKLGVSRETLWKIHDVGQDASFKKF